MLTSKASLDSERRNPNIWCKQYEIYSKSVNNVSKKRIDFFFIPNFPNSCVFFPKVIYKSYSDEEVEEDWVEMETHPPRFVVVGRLLKARRSIVGGWVGLVWPEKTSSPISERNETEEKRLSSFLVVENVFDDLVVAPPSISSDVFRRTTSNEEYKS